MQSYTPIDYYTRIAARKWYVTSPFGPRTGQYAGHHNGIDFGGQPCNAPIPTPYGGKVLAAGPTPKTWTWGNTVTVRIAPGVIQLHAHLNAVRVKPGDVVKPGDIIGLNGGTNNTPTPYACHIHYEIRQDNGSLYGINPRDPAKLYLEQPEPEPPAQEEPAEPEPEPVKEKPEPEPDPEPEPEKPKPRRWPKREPGGRKRTSRWKREIRKW